MIAQRCPTCGALPYHECFSERGFIVAMQAERKKECGKWTKIYDALYRSANFVIDPYRRSA